MYPLIVPLLVCPLCKTLLNSPTTLHCGHTLCAHHLPLTTPIVSCPCPLQECTTSNGNSDITMPSTSRVAYFPAPQSPPLVNTTTNPRFDITINKIVSLVARNHPTTTATPPPYTHTDSDSDTDSESEPLTPVTSTSSLTTPHQPPMPRSSRSRPRTSDSDQYPSMSTSTSTSTSTSNTQSQRPHKRRKRTQHPHAHSHSHSPEPDLLTHLRDQSALQRRIPPDRALIPSNENTSGTTGRSNSPAPNGGTGTGTGIGTVTPASFEKELLSELSCEICFSLFYQPITTPCQHTFCSKCLQRSLDHSPACPLCRQDLPGFSYFQDHPHNKVIMSILLKAFPTAYADRSQAERDAARLDLDTPIFVCQLSFPGMPTLLHFFEPRYRLMLRRCLESPHPSFGMIMPPSPSTSSSSSTASSPDTNNYGTMLEIRSVQMLPDGRSMVETWGTHRFRILERGMLDGYVVGRVERVDDYEDELDEEGEGDVGGDGDGEGGASSEVTNNSNGRTTGSSSSSDQPILSRLASTLRVRPAPTTSQHHASPRPHRHPAPHPHAPTNAQLISTCLTFLTRLREGTAPWVVQRLNNTYGPMPPPETDLSSFSFWVALVLPIDEVEKSKLLPIRSARLRLRLVVHWIEQLNDNWWFSSGCVIF